MNILELIDRLNQIASVIDVPAPHWLSGGGADEGISYCIKCAKENAAEDVLVDGGWVQESDSCCHCEVCGTLLDYSLTDAGVGSELEHFSVNGIKTPSDPETAYHLSRLLEHHIETPGVLVLVPIVTASILAAQQGGGA